MQRARSDGRVALGEELRLVALVFSFELYIYCLPGGFNTHTHTHTDTHKVLTGTEGVW